MDSPLKIQLPNRKQLAAGTVQNLAFRFGLAKPFQVIDQPGPDFKILDDLEGVSWLTSLAIQHDSIPGSFTFEECIMTLNLEKTIVSTALQGRNGTIKEYVTQGDYSITMVAGITHYENSNLTPAFTEYPTDKIKELNRYLNIKDSLKVHSEFLDFFNIESVVIQKFSLNQETHSNRQGVSITMLSDTPYEIKLKQEKDVKVVQ
ncbi:hypothetical protein TH53_17970 [Pedobacter lusitanus]|uniref:DUF6046 domain-containing protein n=1 Tax=Pedobacter lusitanus TaxID=1503925 RepID=A0A0D0FU36_9SPHI|nr:DUF6046 domain-containing protein [Pedobacter lusitanus]KIO75949.1 hypothetical protein TH53_17970 [Pedobacter lusitanus]